MDLKNVKEFLKSDWRKIILTWFFTLLAIFGYVTMYFTPISAGPGFDYWGKARIIEYIAFIGITLSLPSIFALLFFSSLIIFPTNFIFALLAIFVITSLWTYFLSCLIVWIYDKLRGVKKK